MSIGIELRQAREARGIPLRDIADRTKIRLSVLRAIENDDFEHVPGSVIMRGFLKLYAREVGLDPDEIGRRYTAQLEWPERDSATGGGEPGEASRARRPPVTGSVAVVTAVGLVLIAVAAVGFFARPDTPAEPAERSGTEQASSGPAASSSPPAPAAGPVPNAGPPSPVAAASQPAASTGTSGTPSDSGPAATEGLRLDLAASEEVWLAATADGRQVAFRALTAGERLTIQVKDEAVLRIGIPGNLAITINGQPIRPFSRPATPTTIRVTPDSYRDLLASSAR